MKRTRCLLVLLLILPIVRLQTQLLKFRPDSDNFTAEADEDRKLECVYEGEFTGSLSWSGPAVGSGRTTETGNGVTRSILTITNVHLTDAGTYVCSRHSDGEDEDVSAELVVNDDPDLQDPPTEQSLISGTNGSVQCRTYLGHPPATLQWYKDDSPIDTTPGSRFSVDSEGLHIDDVVMDDGGKYRCLLERQGWGTDLEDIEVEVLPGSPCIDQTMHPLVEVLYNEPLNITCGLLAGCAQAQVWWVKPDGTTVHEQTLYLEAPHQPGIYTCFAHNDNGNDRYDVILDIRAPPLPPTSEHDVTAIEGQIIELSADLSEMPNPKPTHTWQSEGGASFPLEQEEPGEQKVYVTEEGALVFRHATVEDSGTYLCTVQNEHGTSMQTVNLQVEPVPPTPTTFPFSYPVTFPVIRDCWDTEDVVLTQLQMLCSCSDVHVIDVTLECQSATEGTYTAIVASESEDPTPLVDKLTDRLKELGVIRPCEPTCSTDPTESGQNMLVPVVVALSVVCVVAVLGAIAAGLYCRHRHRNRASKTRMEQVDGVERGQERSCPNARSALELQVSVVPAPVSCPFPHPSLQHYPVGPFHQQPLTPPHPQPRLQRSPH